MADSPETLAIQDAYLDRIKAFYNILVDNLIRGEANQDQDAEKKFATGLATAKKARDLATDAASTSPTQQVAAVTAKRTSKST